MSEKEDKARKYYEMIAQNVQKGEPYVIKFKNDPVHYSGIPVLDMTSEKEGLFSFQILEPEHNKGMVKKSMEDIESIERL
jgi:hypothetical protein